MEPTRYLLPFTGNMNGKALHHVLQMAKMHDVTVVALVLLPLTKRQKPEEIRLEYLQQAQDFISMFITQAEMYAVHVETHELYTYDVFDAVCRYATHLQCQNILLSYEGEKTYFLQPHEAKKLQVASTHQLAVLYERQAQKREALLTSIRRVLSQGLVGGHLHKNSLSA